MIDTPDGLAALVAERRGARILGLDAEGDGLYRYRSRLCTLQLGDADEVAVVDTLALDDLTPLASLLDVCGPLKVVHDVSFDRKMLATRGLPLGNVFDTAVAARFLGEPSTGLATLLERRLSVRLGKKYQRADWGQRPLDDDRLAYLVEDVRHLPALAEQLLAEARARDVLEEVFEETRYAMERALEPETIRRPWTRVKGARDLDPTALAVLVALADARERVAEARDLPPFRIASNAVLYEAARRRPTTLAQLRRVRGLAKIPDARLEAALEAARRDGPPDLEPDEPPPSPRQRAERKAREKALTAWREAEAAARGVDVQAVLPGHCLRDLARLRDLGPEGLESIRGLGAKRIARYGDALLGCLRAADAGA